MVFRSGLALAVSLILLVPTLVAQEWTTVEYPVASQSPYPNNMRDVSYEVKIAGASMIRVFFEYLDTEPDWDKVEVYDKFGRLAQRLSGRQNRFWSEPVQGDTLILRMTTDFQGSGRGFLVTHAAHIGAPVAPPPAPGARPDWGRGSSGQVGELASIQIYLRDNHRWVPLRPREAIDLYLDDPERGYFEFAIRGYDRRGSEVSSFRFDPRVEYGTQPGNWATLQALGQNIYRFRVSTRTVSGLEVIVYDPGHPGVTGSFWVNIHASRSPVPRGGGGAFGPGPSPRVLAPVWAQVGSTWKQPNWVKRDQDMHVEFQVGADQNTERSFRFVPGAACRVKAVSIYFAGGGREDVTTMGPSLSAGEAYEFTSKLLQEGWQISKIWVNLNAPRRSEHRCYVRMTPSARVPSWVQVGNTWKQPDWVKSNQDMHVEFSVGADHSTEKNFRFVPGAACRVKAVSVHFASGGREDVTTIGPSLRAGEPYDFSSNRLSGGDRITKIWVNLNAPRGTEHRCYVRSRR